MKTSQQSALTCPKTARLPTNHKTHLFWGEQGSNLLPLYLKSYTLNPKVQALKAVHPQLLNPKTLTKTFQLTIVVVLILITWATRPLLWFVGGLGRSKMGYSLNSLKEDIQGILCCRGY